MNTIELTEEYLNKLDVYEAAMLYVALAGNGLPTQEVYAYFFDKFKDEFSTEEGLLRDLWVEKRKGD